MNSYERFADVYDALMTDIPYADYVKWVRFHAPVIDFPHVLDIGCGTGVLAELFVESGYEVCGLDLSEDMLAIASERLGQDVPLYCMSMYELDGFSELDVVTIAIDSLNYVIEEAHVVETLKRIFDALRDGGQLFFDVHSLHKMNNVFLDSPFTYDDGALCYIWHTEQGDFEHSVVHQMTFFVETEQGLYERFDEEHFQRTFAFEQYVEWLCDIGFSNVEVTADWTSDAPTEQSERIFIRAIK